MTFFISQNEPSIFTKYQTKPQLFGGYRKDGALFPLPLSAGKPKGLWEQFEEEKKRAEEQCDRYTSLLPQETAPLF